MIPLIGPLLGQRTPGAMASFRWRQKHPERWKRMQKEYQQAHRKRIAAYNREYYNTPKWREYMRKYMREYNRNRRKKI